MLVVLTWLLGRYQVCRNWIVELARLIVMGRLRSPTIRRSTNSWVMRLTRPIALR